VGSFKHYRDIVIVVLLLALPFFFLRSSIRRPEDTSWVDRALLHVAAPFQYFAALLARGVSGLVGDYVYLVDVKADNNRLAYENANLRSKLSDSERTEADNRRLRRLLGLRETLSPELVSAVVVGKDTTEYFRVAHLTVDTKNAVIRPEMPVISVDGTVGTVLRVAGEKVDVQLTVDSGFGVDVMVERTGARGFVRGIGDRHKYSARVESVQRTDDVDVGDVFVTSGFGCRFPRGMPVARVKKVEKRNFGIYQSVEAEPTVDFSRLEEVMIILTDPKDCESGAGNSASKKQRQQR